jgi:hypothetical protein
MFDPNTKRPKPKQAITLTDILLDFEQFYSHPTVFDSSQTPVVRFPYAAVQACRKLANYRRKDYSTSSHWNPMSEESGIYGEGALQKYLETSLVDAANAFHLGLQGDCGYDYIWQGKKVDQKATMGQARRFKFSKMNKNRNIAEIFSFAWVESVGSECWVHLLGFAHRADIRPFVRDDGRCLVVNFATLQREGVIHPVHFFKQPSNTLSTVITN